MIEYLLLGLSILVIVMFGLLYTYWWKPKECNTRKENKTLHIDSWIWKDGECVANVCSKGYGTPTSDNQCVKPEKDSTRKYTSQSGKCNTLKPKQSSQEKDKQTCEDLCTDWCLAYDYGNQTCNLYDVRPTQVMPGDGKCYILK